MINVAGYFARYSWAVEEVEPGVWRSTFATENDEDFDVYVLVAEDWVHFAVSPFLPMDARADGNRVYATLLRLNQDLRLARFAVDGDGDVNLLADLPLARMSYAIFAQVLDILVYYAGHLAGELRRVATESNYHSPRFD